MRSILTILFLSFFAHAYAGDTLTRAQVYNYYVGDTFDYRTHNINIIVDGITEDTTSQVAYYRYVVINIYWSADTQTKYIVQELLYPTPISLDTFILTDVNGYEVIIDSIDYLGWGVDTFTTNGLINYFGRIENLSVRATGPYWINDLYASGLGQVVNSQSGLFDGAFDYDSTILIYYSGDSGTYGTPYTSFPNAVADISANQSLKLYPTLNNGLFTIETQDEILLPFDLSIYDLEGRTVRQLSISDKRKVIQLPDLSEGLYIWKADNNSSTFSTGKMIIQK